MASPGALCRARSSTSAPRRPPRGPLAGQAAPGGGRTFLDLWLGLGGGGRRRDGRDGRSSRDGGGSRNSRGRLLLVRRQWLAHLAVVPVDGEVLQAEAPAL